MSDRVQAACAVTSAAIRAARDAEYACEEAAQSLFCGFGFVNARIHAQKARAALDELDVLLDWFTHRRDEGEEE